MTEKLYYQTKDQKEFYAVVREVRPGKNDTWEVRLDKTAFYPEGGGQPYDMGWLNDGLAEPQDGRFQIPVLEVHEKDGQIWHTTKIPLAEGTQVQGVLDWERRFRHMQLHSGEHLLSGLIHRYYGYDNVGFHMGKEEVTIDFNGVLSTEQLKRAELDANRMIYENIEITASYPDAETLAALDYRSKKELTGAVRIVEIPGGDCCACCGTHVRSTGAIGMIKATGMINYKGGVRISIQCGLTALEDYERRIRQDATISQLLSAKPTELAGAAEKLKLEAGHKDETINRLYTQLVELKLSAYETSEQPLLVFEPELPPLPLRWLCTKLYEQGKGNIVMVCAGSEGDWHYVIGSSQMDVRIITKELNRRLDGKGGGSAVMTQGTFRADQICINESFWAVME